MMATMEGNKMLKFAVSLVGTAVVVLAALSLSARADSDDCARGYVTSRGTSVAAHCQTNPNNKTLDEYSTRGNINPYIGRHGARNPY